MKELIFFRSIEEAIKRGYFSKNSFSDDKKTKRSKKIILIEDIPDQSLCNPEDILLAKEEAEKIWEGGNFIKVDIPSFNSPNIIVSGDEQIKSYGYNKIVKKPWWKGRFKNEKIKEVVEEY